MQSLLNQITIQETGFFRHPEHFEVLGRVILPKLPQPIKIWSAGCANGQEAFSLAMLLDEQGIKGSVVATDVSTDALQRANAARYSAREVAGLLPDRIARHFVPVGKEWEIKGSLRARVSAVHHNLICPVPEQARSCQVVFCRNVLLYLTKEHTRKFLDNIAAALPAAWLFRGSSETIANRGDRFDTVRIEDTYAYRRRQVGASTAPAPLPVKARQPAGRPRPPRAPSTTVGSDAVTIARLAHDGQRALAMNEVTVAVVLFRQWVYLAPGDPLAQLHLGLALDACDDRPSAQRAFAAARLALDSADPSLVEGAIDGYAAAELRKLIDAKRQGPTL